MLLSRVRRTIREYGLADRGTRVAVAASGGPDSVALARIVAQLAAAGDFAFAGLLHFNHQLRPTAARDEAFCAALAERLHVPIEIGRGDVAAIAASEHRSLEDAAHHARYRFFAEARRRLNADVVALGHTRDDQAETFLLRLLRGAGARGLAAMHPRHDFVVRPLLECRRDDLLGWLAAARIDFVSDETNQDVAIPRNRVRLELLPLLKERFNPGVTDVLAEAAEVARGEWEWLTGAADEAFESASRVTDGQTEFDAAALVAMPLALRRAVVWRGLSHLSSRPVMFRHVTAALSLLDHKSAGHRVEAPGQIVERIGDRLVLKGRSASRPAGGTKANLFEYPLSIPGEVLVAEASGVVSAAESTGNERVAPDEAGGAVVRRDLCGSRLTIRNRRPGDRLRPLGLGGRKKLQDLFVDRKVARADRDRIPLVVAENGRILWVAGFGISEEFRVTDPTQPMLILRFKVLGGRV